MGRATVQKEIAASAAQVWDIVRDFGGVQRWSPGLSSCEVDKEGVGAVRTIKLGDMVIREKLESLDDATRTFSYSIVEAPLPLSNYLSTFTVADTEPGKSQITWSATFDAAGMTDEQAAQMVEGIYHGGIKGLRGALGL